MGKILPKQPQEERDLKAMEEGAAVNMPNRDLEGNNSKLNTPLGGNTM